MKILEIYFSRVTFFFTGKKKTLRWRADMASGGEGFGTERARLAGNGLRTERARLAQGGYCEKALAQNVQD